MSSRYRIEYHLKSHRKDAFIDWIKNLLSVPFVLHSTSQGSSSKTHFDYLQIFKNIESLIDEKLSTQVTSNSKSRLERLVPTIGTFFTSLPVSEAFIIEDNKRAISQRLMVSPSFNDIRHILNTAQILQLAKANNLKLITFDGDVTLYEDGGSMTMENKSATRIIQLLKRHICVGIVTAAGYDDSELYESRLFGLLRQLELRDDITLEEKQKLTIMGGESNFLFQYNEINGHGYFRRIEEAYWMPKSIQEWSISDINATLDLVENCFKSLKISLKLPDETKIIRKKKAVGLVPGEFYDTELGKNIKLFLQREALEEIVLNIQSCLELFEPASRLKFSCFDGGNDVWCDIGGKDIGIQILQTFYDPETPIMPFETLHVGDQFAPIGSANDFKTRLSSCTSWIASPQETVNLLDDLLVYMTKNSQC